MPKPKPKSFEALFQTLVAETLPKGDTWGEARKRREAKKKHSLLNTKRKLERKHDKLVDGSMKKVKFEVIILRVECQRCKKETRQTKEITLISRSPHTEMTEKREPVYSSALFDMYKYLPIHVKEGYVTTPICVECVEHA